MRETPEYRDATALYTMLRRPGSGQIYDAAQIQVAPDARHAVFAGTFSDTLESEPCTRICLVELSSGRTEVVTSGPNQDRLPRYSPDGSQIAFLSDRHDADDLQLYLLDPGTGAIRSGARVDGWVEDFQWGRDGKRILLGVASRGADLSGAQGATTSRRAADNLPSWMPKLEVGDHGRGWRRAWVCDVSTGLSRQVSLEGSNIWEAVWCGDTLLAAIVSSGPSEGLWYSASLQTIDMASGIARCVYQPRYQLGCLAASPSGRRLAVVDAVCSDRGIVAGELLLIDSASGEAQGVDSNGVDVSHAEWRSERYLLLAGHRGFETVVGVYDVSAGRFRQVWASEEISAGPRYSAVSGLDDSGDCVLIGEGYLRAPEIALIRQGQYHTVRSFNTGYAEQARAIATVSTVSWSAPDGLEIQGWLLQPRLQEPAPLVTHLHGGPVWQWHPSWLGRSHVAELLLLRKGYAIFLPNPRGSSGRGHAFTRLVLGDLGGADSHDCLSGIDHLVARGIADPRRLGLTGGSYGGFLTTWLITQDTRFAAAIALAPITNHVTQQLLSNIPQFTRLFLQNDYTEPGGRHYERSPILHARKVTTPTLSVCGALDRCTPPEEAAQFHNALLQSGAKSVLVTYPEEGHRVRRLPAAADHAARVVAWFEEHMPATHLAAASQRSSG